MQVTIAFTEERARRIMYALRRRYANKKELPALVRMAVDKEVSAQAVVDLAAIDFKEQEATG